MLTSIKSIENEKMDIDQHDDLKLIVFLDKTERKHAISQYITTNNGSYTRSRFRNGFHDILTKKIQEKGVKCWLNCVYYWFSRDNKSWHGLYKCIAFNCDIKYDAKIELISIEENIIKVIIRYQKQEIHEHFISKTRRCTGTERKKQALELMANGVSNNQFENLLFNKTVDSSASNIFKVYFYLL